MLTEFECLSLSKHTVNMIEFSMLKFQDWVSESLWGSSVQYLGRCWRSHGIDWLHIYGKILEPLSSVQRGQQKTVIYSSCLGMLSLSITCAYSILIIQISAKCYVGKIFHEYSPFLLTHFLCQDAFLFLPYGTLPYL